MCPEAAAFQYPLFRIELLCFVSLRCWVTTPLFQYPLFRIELLCQKNHPAISLLLDSFNIRSFGSNFSAMPCFSPQRAFGKFQYPLFRIKLLCYAYAAICMSMNKSFNIRSFGSNFSAFHFSDPQRGGRVSISALSDRTSLHGENPQYEELFNSFNIRSFGSNFSASHAARGRGLCNVFQYPLFRIELLCQRPPPATNASQGVSISALSDRTSLLRARARILVWLVCFNIRSFGSNFSAQRFVDSVFSARSGFNIRSFGSNFSACTPTPCTGVKPAFQYPLFRIELLCALEPLPVVSLPVFQYPLFRIELLCLGPCRLSWPACHVSISALSDRTSLRVSIRANGRAVPVSISALSDRTSLRDARAHWRELHAVSISALSDRTSLQSLSLFGLRRVGVSISALSDRTSLQPAPPKYRTR